MRIRKGDTVQVITGKEKGKTGKVIEIAKGRVLIQGLNMVKRHQKPTQTQRQGGIVEKESSIHISNVQPYDEKAAKGARVGVKVLEDGKKVRVSRRSGEVLEAVK